MKILGIDPGRTTGWAMLTFNDKGINTTLNFGETKDLNLLEIQNRIEEADQVVYESFLLRPKQARKGSFDWDPMETPQVIGSLKLLCRQLGKPIAEQNPSIKPVGYGFANMKYVPGKKGMHAQDAICHAFYYAVKNVGLKPILVES